MDDVKEQHLSGTGIDASAEGPLFCSRSQRSHSFVEDFIRTAAQEFFLD
jgi:hypothetical protein